MNYRSIRTRTDGTVCHLQLYRPDANNTISAEMIDECRAVVEQCEAAHTVLVIEGLPEVFCFGADFKAMGEATTRPNNAAPAGELAGAAALYDLWQRVAGGSFISVAHVRGQANAGGMGFVAACDVVIADASARFSLSELLFGLYPACVLPFLARRIGLQRANYMTVTTQPVGVEQATSWGLVDAWHANSETILQRHLHRMKRLSKTSVAHYKSYLRELDPSLVAARGRAIAANRDMHVLPGVMQGIARYVETGAFPWE